MPPSNAALRRGDGVEGALRAERILHQTAPGSNAVSTLRKLAELALRRLTTMHGSCFEGDGRRALLDLAGGYVALNREQGEAQ